MPWRQRRTEFLLSAAAFLAVALLGVLQGIAIAVALSVLNVLRRAWWPYDTALGKVDGLEGYHDVRSYPQAQRLPGLVIYRFDAPLFFANAKTFRDEVRRLAATESRSAWIVIAAEPITDVDTTAADMLEELDEALKAEQVHLVFAELKDPARRKIVRARAPSSRGAARNTRAWSVGVPADAARDSTRPGLEGSSASRLAGSGSVERVSPRTSPPWPTSAAVCSSTVSAMTSRWSGPRPGALRGRPG